MNETDRGLSWHQWRDPEVLMTCGFGSGFSPVAPGTAGSLVAVALWVWLLAPLPVPVQVAVIALVTGLGTWLIARVQARYRVDDPGAIVVDEFAGQWIVLLAAPAEWWAVAGGFVLFRLFDIVKPWPIGALERRVGGAFGVMVDDLVAGLAGWVVLQFTLLAIGYF